MNDEAIQVSKTHVNFDEMGWPLPDGRFNSQRLPSSNLPQDAEAAQPDSNGS
jgi:hypothetical protein